MVNETIEKGLKPYGIGEKLRALRLRKKMGLVELGKHTGLSAAMLSKVERGKLYPTLPTLLRISMVFSVGLDHFFEARRRNLVAITRAGERNRFPERPGSPDVSYEFESLDFPATERKLSAYVAHFQPVEPAKQKVHTHAGVEVLYVIEGKLGLRIGGEEHELDAGDSIYFDAAVPHCYRRLSKGNCVAVVVAVP